MDLKMQAIKSLRERYRSRHTLKSTKTSLNETRLKNGPPSAEELAGTLKAFKYRPLETPITIRVIKIVASHGDNTEPIACYLEHMQLNRHTYYQALSYEWGSPTAKDDGAAFPLADTTILLNGSLITVRRNLFHALSHLRRFLSHQPIWIDALSINQSDTLERNHQVGLMGFIYGGATKVLIWPGRTGSSLEDAGFAVPYDFFSHAEISLRCLVEELCERTYWKRVWIQQEVFLARTLYIMHGRHGLLPFEKFDSQVALSMHEKSPFVRGVSAKIGDSAASALVMRKHVGLSLSPLATWLRMACDNDLQTSEPRDLIYSMLAISSDCQDGAIEPDYDKPLIDVYLETVFFCGLHKPGQEFSNQPFLKTLAGKLGLLWDSDMETRIQEYRQQRATVRRGD